MINIRARILGDYQQHGIEPSVLVIRIVFHHG